MIKYNEFSGWIIRLIFIFLPVGDIGAKIRGMIYKPFFKKCGKNLMIPSKTHIFNPNRIKIGDNVYLGYNSYYGEGDLIIGNNALIGPFVSITATNHIKKNGSFRFGGYIAKPIIIEDNVWIGAHACILSGVTIGKGAVIGAGAVVTKNVSQGAVVGGVPAKIII